MGMGAQRPQTCIADQKVVLEAPLSQNSYEPGGLKLAQMQVTAMITINRPPTPARNLTDEVLQ
jgi:hypothetical protein